MKDPEISVVMPVFNGSSTIKTAIDSILKQSYHDFELIIVDDGSTDNTVEIIKNYQERRIKLICNKVKMGIASSLNRGLAAARGKYIARMDADDYSLPDRLLKEKVFLDNHPETGLIGSWVIIKNTISGAERLVKLPVSGKTTRQFVYKDNPFIHSSVMFRRELLPIVGMYNPDYCWEDYDLWIRMLKVTQGMNLPEALVIRYENSQNVTQTIKKAQAYYERLRLQYKAHLLLGFSFFHVLHLLKTTLLFFYYRIMEGIIH